MIVKVGMHCEGVKIGGTGGFESNRGLREEGALKKRSWWGNF